MQKIFAILIVFLSCSAVGMKSAQRLRHRARLLAALQISVRRFMMAMEYEKKPLYRIAMNRDYGEVQPLWSGFGAALSEGASTVSAFERAMAAADGEIPGFSALGGEERELLRRFVRELGSTDLKNQRANAALLLGRLEELAAAAEQENSVKGRVYRTMGVLCGAAVAILML